VPRPFQVFINYRREDSGGWTGRIYDALTRHSSLWKIFRDIDAIGPGADFGSVIDRTLGSCDVVIAVIGPRWLDATDERGRRLEQRDDYVRRELLQALDRELPLFPTLVEGAKMPQPDNLPRELAGLARWQAHELSDGRWEYDIERLIRALDGMPAARRAAEQERRARLPLRSFVGTTPGRELGQPINSNGERELTLFPDRLELVWLSRFLGLGPKPKTITIPYEDVIRVTDARGRPGGVNIQTAQHRQGYDFYPKEQLSVVKAELEARMPSLRRVFPTLGR
jgi:hypothetical protein